MQETLQYLQSIEGVIGVAVSNEHGKVIDYAFPALIDSTTIQKSAYQILELIQGLQIDQTFELIDLRYAEGRILVKRIPSNIVYLLCSKTINLHIIATNLNLAANKIKSIGTTVLPVTKPSKEIIPIELRDVTDDPSVLTLRISHLTNKEASASFDSLGMVAVSQSTSQYISDFYMNQFKKISLTSKKSGKSGTFPCMVMKDMEPKFDGTIIVGPGIEKKLSITEGDKVEVRVIF